MSLCVLFVHSERRQSEAGGLFSGDVGQGSGYFYGVASTSVQTWGNRNQPSALTRSVRNTLEWFGGSRYFLDYFVRLFDMIRFSWSASHVLNSSHSQHTRSAESSGPMQHVWRHPRGGWLYIEKVHRFSEYIFWSVAELHSFLPKRQSEEHKPSLQANQWGYVGDFSSKSGFLSDKKITEIPTSKVAHYFLYWSGKCVVLPPCRAPGLFTRSCTTTNRWQRKESVYGWMKKGFYYFILRLEMMQESNNLFQFHCCC